jgi:hypothetical protein
MTGPRIHFHPDATPEHREQVQASVKTYTRAWTRASGASGACFGDVLYCPHWFDCPCRCGCAWPVWAPVDIDRRDLAQALTLCPICSDPDVESMTEPERVSLVHALSHHPDALAHMAVQADLAQHEGKVTMQQVAQALLEVVNYHHPADLARNLELQGLIAELEGRLAASEYAQRLAQQRGPQAERRGPERWPDMAALRRAMLGYTTPTESGG